MEPWLIGYILFQIMIYVLTALTLKGGEIRTGIQVAPDNYREILLVSTIPAINLMFFFHLILGENSIKDIKIGLNEYKNVYHYLILALPILALVSLFFVKI